MLSRSRSLIIVSSSASDGKEKEKERERTRKDERKGDAGGKERERERQRSMSCPRGVHSYPDDPPVERILLAVYYVRAMHRAGERARIYKSYVRCIQEEHSREMRRVAQPRKKRAQLGNIYGYVRTCICTKRWENATCGCMRASCVRAVGRVKCTRTHINAEAGKRVRASRE